VEEYGGNIARDLLHKAEGELLSAQNYLRVAGAPPRLMRRISRLINGARLLLDLIHDELDLEVTE